MQERSHYQMEWTDELFEQTAPQNEITRLLTELTEARTSGDDETIADLLGLLGREYRLRERYSEAMRYLTESLRRFNALNNLDGKGWCFRERGQLFIAMRDFGKAEEELLAAHGYYLMSENVGEQAWCLLEMGVVYRWRKQYAEAELLLANACKLAQLVQDKLAEAYCCHEFGIVEHKRGNYENALKWLKKAGDQYVAIDSRTGYANMLGDMGCVAIDMGRWKEASLALHESMRHDEALGYTYGMGINAFNLGWLHLRRGEKEESAQWATKAHALFASLDIPLPDFGRELLGELRRG